MDDVPWEEPLLPAALREWQPDMSEGAPSIAQQLVVALRPYDDEMATRVRELTVDGKVPVQLSVVDCEAGTASVSIETFDAASRMARCSANENIVEIESRRY